MTRKSVCCWYCDCPRRSLSESGQEDGGRWHASDFESGEVLLTTSWPEDAVGSGARKLLLFMYCGRRAVTGSGQAHCRILKGRHGRHDMMHDARGAYAQASKRIPLVLPGNLVMLFLMAPSCRHIEVAVRSGQLAWIHIKCLPGGVGLGMGRCLEMPLLDGVVSLVKVRPMLSTFKVQSQVQAQCPEGGVCVCVSRATTARLGLSRSVAARYCCDRRPEYCARDLSRCR